MRPALGGLLLVAVLGNGCDRARVESAPTEVVRLRAHFDSVDGELRRAEVAHLTPAQQEARAALIAWLREYRNAGSFPVNDRS
jgi:hypothetical protein